MNQRKRTSIEWEGRTQRLTLDFLLRVQYARAWFLNDLTRSTMQTHLQIGGEQDLVSYSDIEDITDAIHEALAEPVDERELSDVIPVPDASGNGHKVEIGLSDTAKRGRLRPHDVPLDGMWEHADAVFVPDDVSLQHARMVAGHRMNGLKTYYDGGGDWRAHSDGWWRFLGMYKDEEDREFGARFTCHESDPQGTALFVELE